MKRTVLVVDDKKMNRDILKRSLHADYVVLEAENGEEAIEVMEKNRMSISAVLLDVVMPVMDGYETLQHVRDNALLAQIPVIVVTGSTDEQSRAKALSLGASDFLVKPFTPNILLHCLKNNIALRETSSVVNTLRIDKLTGLYNQDAFYEMASERIKAHEPGYYILSCLNIDNFKIVNDLYGEETGDLVLKHLADCIGESMSAVDGICCRLSGDRFATLFPTCFGNSSVLDVYHQKASKPGCIDQTIIVRIGRYSVTDLSLPVSAMCDRASLAQASIKGKYGQYIAEFDESMRGQLIIEQQIVSEMADALRLGQFEPWFQPQYNHASGAMIGAEALVRWRHPQKGLIAPNDFIPIFERNGFIYAMDKYIWEEVCRYLRKWMSEGLSPLPVSLNISRYDILHPDVVFTITQIVNKYNIPKELVRLEVTESAFAKESAVIIKAVKALIDRGFTVEIDDFGSGYSSLNTLKDVPAQIIKLDMKFLKSSDDLLRGGNIVESIVRMAKWLGMSVIAEGVETIEQANYLLSVGCCYMQGYLYARPMPAETYAAYCRDADQNERLLTLETVENLNNNAFWDPNSMDTLIFSSFVGAACIFEYHGGKAELLRVNTKFSAMLGFKAESMEEALKFDLFERLTPDSLELMHDTLRRSSETYDEYTEEYRFRDIPDFPPEFCLRMTMRVIAKAGDRRLVYCTSENITEQRQAEKRERLAAEQIRSMMDDMPGGFIKMRADEGGSLKPVYINEGYYKLFGTGRGKPVETDLADIFADVHPDDADAVHAFLERLLEHGNVRDIRFRQKNESGSYIWLSVTGRVSSDETGGAFLNLYYSDVTEQVNEEETERKLLDNLPCGAGVYELKDGQMSLVYQNKSYWDLVGLHEETFPDPAEMSAVHPEDIPVIMQELSAAIQQNRDVACDIRLRHLTLGYRLVHLSGRIVPDATGGLTIYASFLPYK